MLEELPHRCFILRYKKGRANGRWRVCKRTRTPKRRPSRKLMLEDLLHRCFVLRYKKGRAQRRTRQSGVRPEFGERFPTEQEPKNANLVELDDRRSPPSLLRSPLQEGTIKRTGKGFQENKNSRTETLAELDARGSSPPLLYLPLQEGTSELADATEWRAVKGFQENKNQERKPCGSWCSRIFSIAWFVLRHKIRGRAQRRQTKQRGGDRRRVSERPRTREADPSLFVLAAGISTVAFEFVISVRRW